VRAVAGLLLTGGASRRFGADKATLLVDGERLADRSLRILGAVADPVIEVGPGLTGASAVREEPAGSGPLAAIAAGGETIRATGSPHVLVLAVDLPAIDVPTLAWLAQHPAPTSVVPVVGGRRQSLCARYDAAALVLATELVASGERSMHALLDAIDVHDADEAEWAAIADARAFADVDTREDAAELGVDPPR
jgi:molybdopterin-guanine dinucleotide biosynthesis protein A